MVTNVLVVNGASVAFWIFFYPSQDILFLYFWILVYLKLFQLHLNHKNGCIYLRIIPILINRVNDFAICHNAIIIGAIAVIAIIEKHYRPIKKTSFF